MAGGILSSLKVIIGGDARAGAAAANETAAAMEHAAVSQARLEVATARSTNVQAQAALSAAKLAGDEEALAAATNVASAAQARLAEAIGAQGIAQAEAGVGKATREVQGLGQAAGGAGGLMAGIGDATPSIIAAGIAAGVAAKVFGSLKDAASNLNEQVQAAKVTFAGASDSVIGFAQTAVGSFGLSERSALQAANGFAALFKGAGLGTQDVATFSTSLTKLGADIASFKNLNQGDVLEQLRSGLTGQVRPLRDLGIIINDATVTSKALELGLGDLNGNVSDGAKVLARYALILEQTKDAQGDYARTSEQAANAQRTLSAQWENLSATLGASVLPVYAQVATDLANITGNANEVTAAFGGLSAIAKVAFSPVLGPLDLANRLFGDNASAVEKSRTVQAGYLEDQARIAKAQLDTVSSAEEQAKALQSSQTALEGVIGALGSYQSTQDSIKSAEDALAKGREVSTKKIDDEAKATRDAQKADQDLASAERDLNKAKRDAPLELAQARDDDALATDNVAEKTKNLTTVIEKYGVRSIEAAKAQHELNKARDDATQASRKAEDLAAGGDRPEAVLQAEQKVADAKQRQADAAAAKTKAGKEDPVADIAKLEEAVARAKDKQVLDQLHIVDAITKYNDQFGTSLEYADAFNGKLDAAIDKQAQLVLQIGQIALAKDNVTTGPPQTEAAINRREFVLPSGGTPTVIARGDPENPFVQKFGPPAAAPPAPSHGETIPPPAPKPTPPPPAPKPAPVSHTTNINNYVNGLDHATAAQLAATLSKDMERKLAAAGRARIS